MEEEQRSLNKDQQKTLLRSVLFTFLVSGAASQALGPMLPYLENHHGFGKDFSGLLISGMSLGTLVAIFLTGVLPTLIGRRKSILWTSVWMMVSFAFIASGLAPYWLLLPATILMGVARGGNSNFSNTMVSTLPENEAAKGYNLLHAFFAIGACLSPLLLMGSLKQFGPQGWRVMAGIMAGLCLAQFLVYIFMPLPAERIIPKGTSKMKSIDKSFLKNLDFWLGVAILFFYVSAEYAIMGWLVSYFKERGVINPDYSVVMNTLLWIVIFVGRLIGAFISSKISKIDLLLINGIGFFAFFLLMFLSTTPAPVITGLMGAGFFMSTIYATALSLGAKAVNGNDFGTSIQLFVGTFGGIITPAIVGFIAKSAGMNAGMGFIVVLTALLLVCIILSYIITKKHNKQEN